MNANLHFHMLLLDGVYTKDEATGELSYHHLRPPSDGEVGALVVEAAVDGPLT